ncbi:transcription-repair coupling factor [candidate division CSSED10-310 bacterium]|uniref:Transcription-repair-coupling factor n=1 Tax=candidate division CSSED10-310 bacterium TaxID=2855610 RepID=A0ABV6Z0E7_UNCC1
MVFNNFLNTLSRLQRDSAQKCHLSGLWGASRAYLASYILEHWNGPVLFIAPSIIDAERFYSDLLYFCSREKTAKNTGSSVVDPRQNQVQAVKSEMLPSQDNLSEAALSLSSEIGLFPPWELLPLETMSPYASLSHTRLVTLHTLFEKKLKSIVAPIDALMKKNIPLTVIAENSQKLEIFQHLDRDRLIDILDNNGYQHVDIVEETGDFAVRGGVIDVFIPLYLHPVRIEFVGDQIESLREFDVESQRSLSQLLSVHIMPCREIPYSKEAIKKALEQLETFKLSNPENLNTLENLSERIEQRLYFDGIEWYQPLFYGPLEPLFSQLPSQSLVVILDQGKVTHRMSDFEKLIKGEFRHYQPGRYPYYPLESFYLTPADVAQELTRFPIISFSLFASDQADILSFDFRPQSIPLFRGHLEKAMQFLTPYLASNFEITLVTRQKAEKQLVQQAIDDHFLSESAAAALHQGQQGTMEIVEGTLSQGFVFPDLKRIFISAYELFQEKAKRAKSTRFRGHELISSLRDLKKGDYVVHIDHGIGCYTGTEELLVEGVMRDFLILTYADNDKLYLPMERINLIQRYSTAENAVKIKLDKLGAARWAKVKAKAKRSIQEMALELIELYAAREVLQGFRFSADEQWQREFEVTFPFEETIDQLRAIEDVKTDMENENPMDRLVCGDVGFGKTEVAMRAAFKAVMNHKQVAVLAPTTILAQQHYMTFRKRFNPFPITVEVLSRFRSPKEQKNILLQTAQGQVDILIGTHRILQKDIQFKNLGFIVVDEEQRFGVAHKEKLKKLKKKADVLTLTATPIPRTLHMSISGLRDMSIINTPPENRLAIQTKVMKFSGEVIKEAIMREIQRGGQVYFVHNRVHTIYSVATYLANLLPGITFAVAHGQMKEKELKKIMDRFLAKEFDVLISTTIIESGIDIPSVNTMLINRADKLGLAQLYQLRGRVGRAHHRAYCYLLIPDVRLLNKVARQRLKVIQELTDLGSGFRIAAHDLEIRGTGNLLGAQQHGHINAIGFDLYCSLLEHAVRELKGEKQRPDIETVVTLPFEAYIPKTFIPDTNQRLMIYRKLAMMKNQVALDEFEEELNDRYGTLPVVVQRLLNIKAFSLECNTLAIERLEIGSGNCVIHFAQFISYVPEQLIEILSNDSNHISFTGAHSVKISTPDKSTMEIYQFMQTKIKELKNKKENLMTESPEK